MLPALLKALRFFGLLLLNVFVAVIGTAVLDSAVRRALPPHTIGAVFAKETALSIICASLIGFGMWRTWRSEPAKWTLVIPSLWFTFGLLAVAGHGIWGPLLVSSASNFGAAEMRSFFLFTIPLIRAAAYSAGAYISSFVFDHAVASDQ
jgi:CDP-diglyceride synthetase